MCRWATRHYKLYKILTVAQQCVYGNLYVAGNNTTYVGLHVKCPMQLWNSRMFVCLWSSVDVQFGWRGRSDRWVVAQCLSFCIADKHFTWDGIHCAALSIKCYECACACVSMLAYVIRRVSRIVSVPYYIVICGQTARSSKKKVIEHKMCVFIFSATFVCCISHPRSQRDTIINARRCSCKVPVILVIF
jgi:hypothetical protein